MCFLMERLVEERGSSLVIQSKKEFREEEKNGKRISKRIFMGWRNSSQSI